MSRFARICAYLVAILVLWQPTASIGATQNTDDSWLVFSRFDDTSRQISYLNVSNGQIREYDLGDVRPQVYAVPTTGTHIAFANSDGTIIIFDIASGESLMLDVTLNMHNEMIYDHAYVFSRSMIWSSDGENLAFTGNVDGQTAIFVYSVTDEQLVNLTTDSPLPYSRIEVTSWSPDDQWLVLMVEWENGDDAENSQVSPALISTTGQLIPLLDAERLCRVAWSPQGNRLASTTRCYHGPPTYDDTDVLVVDFLVGELTPPTRTTRISAPDSMHMLTQTPFWLDEERFAVIRNIGPIGVNLSPDDFREEVVVYEVSSDGQILSEDVIFDEIDFGAFVTNSWAIWYESRRDSDYQWHLKGYNLVDGRILDIPVEGLCPAAYARVSQDNQWLSLQIGCQEDQESAVLIYDLASYEHSMTIPVNDYDVVQAWGFMRLQ